MLEIIRELIKEYYEMEKGDLIKKYLDEIVFTDSKIIIKMTFRSLKHIVEQRKKDSYTINDIERIFTRLQDLFINENYRIIKDSETFIFTEIIYEDNKGLFIILEVMSINSDSFSIKTAFFRTVSKIKSYLKKIIS